VVVLETAFGECSSSVKSHFHTAPSRTAETPISLHVPNCEIRLYLCLSGTSFSGQRPAKKPSNGIGNLAIVGLEREVSGVIEMDLRIGIVTLKRFGPRGQKERIVLSPNCKQ
jgi:hypothetical protein